MRERLTERLQELCSEFQAGQKKLAETEAEVQALRETLLRISGAIQVLKEELGREAKVDEDTALDRRKEAA